MLSVTVLPSTILYGETLLQQKSTPLSELSVFNHPNCYAILSRSLAQLLKPLIRTNSHSVALSLSGSNDHPIRVVAWRPADVIPPGYQLQQDGLYMDVVSQLKQQFEQLRCGKQVEEEISHLLKIIDTLQHLDNSNVGTSHLMLLSQPFLESLKIESGDVFDIEIHCIEDEDRAIVQAELTPDSTADYELLEDQIAHVEVSCKTVPFVFDSLIDLRLHY